MRGKGGGRGSLRIAYLGRLVQQQKRVFDLPLLLDALATRGVDFTLTLIGDGADRAPLEQRLAMSRGRERVRLLGWLPSEKALEALAASDVQLLVSDFEGQPISTLEAMASGVVPVVTDLPGERELIRDCTSGFLLPVGDMEAFASTLARLSAATASGFAAWQEPPGNRSRNARGWVWPCVISRCCWTRLPGRHCPRPSQWRIHALAWTACTFLGSCRS